MGYGIKAVVENENYTYAGYPHEDMRIVISVWKDTKQVPISTVVADLSRLESQDAAFARTFNNVLSVFDEEWKEKGFIEDGDEVFSWLCLCNVLSLECKLAEITDCGVAIEDRRTEESKDVAKGVYKLWHEIDNPDEYSGQKASAVAKKLSKKLGVPTESVLEWYSECVS